MQAADESATGANADSVAIVTDAMQRLSAEPSGDSLYNTPSFQLFSLSALEAHLLLFCSVSLNIADDDSVTTHQI